ncbi:MAG TPA: plasmid partitioning protein RepB [Paracoccus sp. (in: a-proteobacteria)]|uniref:plasmid partitioning protein RepB n=1 Tax=Paracoccus sp. TaxID=267 RepID=UPI002B789592|nr:plasmid partitioning protein RepB [Paracoccus sp. (in: a-proteobacteria)]HWL57102.1 plasmid partitioning protein RepB [Paracoccus sp. (in: a-proteobacteria)]
MARKLFGMIENAPDPVKEGAKSIISADKPRVAADSGGSMLATSRLSAGLMELHSNTIRDLNPASISEGGLRDRIALDDDGIAELADSIRANGQHVPIMVRPLPGHTDRFQIVYGRRRLAAIRLIGNLPVRAIVRSLKDEEAIIAQGQENNQRLDPSHIERALFALELRQAGYSTEVIQQAVGLDRYSVSRYIKVAQDIPMSVIEAIGAAHDIGRRYWREFGDLLLAAGKAGEAAVIGLLTDASAQSMSSAERFHLVLGHLKGGREEVLQPSGADPTPTATTKSQLSRGSTRAKFGRKGMARVEMKADDRAVSLTVRVKDSPEFSAWLRKHAESVVADLEKRWIEEGKGG